MFLNKKLRYMAIHLYIKKKQTIKKKSVAQFLKSFLYKLITITLFFIFNDHQIFSN